MGSWEARGNVVQWASHRIRCPPGSFRRQFTKPTTPEVVQPTAISHTGREEESARMFCRRMQEELTGRGMGVPQALALGPGQPGPVGAGKD